MKIYGNKKIALLLAFMLMVPIFWQLGTAVASAATTPTFKTTKVEIVGVGEKYQLEIKNKVAKSTYKWSSSKKTVAKVSTKGLVTSVGPGSTNISCKITYPTRKTKTITCKVTVTIPATEIKIVNATVANGLHTMTLGSTFDFDYALTPANSSYKAYWSVEYGDAECIRIDNKEDGLITATKAGTVAIKVNAVKSSTLELAKESIIDDVIIISVVAPSAPTATVKSAEIIGSTEIKVVFDSPIDKSTIIDSSNKLTNNITISLQKDAKNVLADDPGTLTPNLSADLTTLTITSANMFDGNYAINVTSGIKTSGGVAIKEYYKQLTYIDTAPPAILSTDLDDTGMITTINFTEAIDITNLKVTATEVYTSSSSGTASTTTYNTLQNASNYVLSENKKTLTVNLSKILSTDYGKMFTIVFAGIKDLSGNAPVNYTLTTVVRTDNSKKDQAVPYLVTRTAKNTLTAHFNRAIQTPGRISITGGSTYTGEVDATDGKKVNYAISEIDSLLTGVRTVSIGFYNSYNVKETDTSAYTMRSFNVDFIVDQTSPVLITPEYVADTGILSFTFNEEVNLTNTAGIFSATLDTTTGERIPGTNISYTQVASTDKRIVKLKITNMTRLGSYSFTVDPTFAKDGFNNQMIARTITIGNTTGTSSELPGPFAITQSSDNLSKINLEFLHMLDVDSAQTVSNYSIPGVTIMSAYVSKNTTDNGATVVLTVVDGSIDANAERPITIKGIMGYKGSHSAITTFTKTFELKENKKPEITSFLFDTINRNNIKINFNEQIKGTMTVRVTLQTSATPVEYSNTVTIIGNSVVINLGVQPTPNSYLRVDVLTNSITDMNGNAVTSIQPSTVVVANY